MNFGPFSNKFLSDAKAFLSLMENQHSGLTVKDLLDILETKVYNNEYDRGKQSTTKKRQLRKVCLDCGRKMKFCGVTGIHECKCGYSILEK